MVGVTVLRYSSELASDEPPIRDGDHAMQCRINHVISRTPTTCPLLNPAGVVGVLARVDFSAIQGQLPIWLEYRYAGSKPRLVVSRMASTYNS